MDNALSRLYRRALHHEFARVWGAILGLAVCTGLLDFLHVYISYRLGNEVLPWGTIAYEYSLWWLTYLVLVVIALLMARRFTLTPGVITGNLGIHFVAALLLAYAHAISNALVDTPRSGLIAETPRRVVYLAGLDFPIDFVSYWAIVGLSSAFCYYSIARRNEEQSRKAALYTRTLIETSLDPLVTVSCGGKITDANRAAE